MLQLINALDEDGNVIPFRTEYEQILSALGSQAAICLTNRQYAQQIQKMLDSFVRVMTTAVDERSPYTANHTNNMTLYAKRFINWLNRQQLGWSFNEKEEYIFLMSVRLHDIGKLITPAEIMDKKDRLGENYQRVMDRLDRIRLLTKIERLQGIIGEDGEKQLLEDAVQARELIDKVNEAGFLTDTLRDQVMELTARTYEEEDGTVQPWITKEERQQLLIKRGTLTEQERQIMQDHVEMTRRMLEQMEFGEEYKEVVTYAIQHHERLNGSGYPRGLRGDK